jgi:hypothetical protein
VTERLIAGKGKNHDFIRLDDETQHAFLTLHRFLYALATNYEEFLWEEAQRKEDKGMGIDPIRAGLPEKLRNKLDAVQACREEALTRIQAD